MFPQPAPGFFAKRAFLSVTPIIPTATQDRDLPGWPLSTGKKKRCLDALPHDRELRSEGGKESSHRCLL